MNLSLALSKRAKPYFTHASDRVASRVAKDRADCMPLAVLAARSVPCRENPILSRPFLLQHFDQLVVFILLARLSGEQLGTVCCAQPLPLAGTDSFE